MEANITLEILLCDLLTPIINKAIEDSIKKYLVIPEPLNIDKEVLTTIEAAGYLRIAVPTLYSLVQNKKITYSKASKRLYFRKEDLYSYLTQNRQKSLDEIKVEADKRLVRRWKKF